jgi:hypothetical protein
MRKLWLAWILVASLIVPSGGLDARPNGIHRSSSYSTSHSHSTHTRTTHVRAHRTRTSSAVRRSSHGRIKRSRAATDAFKREHPCPPNGRRSGPCRGYVIDHVVPLACGGRDDPSNMQWQTAAEAKAKDKWERKGCK